MRSHGGTTLNETRTYRPEVDGLRAIAVLAVVAYHLEVAPVSGGFVGVDVFFVISGYLITSLVTRELATKRFSVLAFYDRRMRRILPALLLVIFASLVAGWVLLLPVDFRSLGYQAASAATGVSNVYFLHNTSYFDPAAGTLPLLHTWTLGVEEQFYLFWPLVALLIWRLSAGSRRATVAFLAVVILLSFGWAAYTVGVNAKIAFYMLPGRAWELALGALLAFAPALPRRWLGEGAVAVGLALIAVSVFTLDDDSAFPGLNAVPPCLGAALIVWPSRLRSVAARALGVAPAAFGGRISYSMYLWHWPLLVFFRVYANGAAPTAVEAAVLFAATLVLSVLSWWLVEQPFRRRRGKEAVTVGVGVAAMAAVAGLGLLVVAGAGFPSRLPPEGQVYASYMNGGGADHAREGIVNCFTSTRQDGDGRWTNPCLRLAPDRPNVLVIGDSHSGRFSLALTEDFPDVQFFALRKSGCRPVLHPSGRAGDPDVAQCRELMPRAFEDIIPATHFDAIILVARWSMGPTEVPQLPATVNYLAQYADRVIVFGQTLEYQTDLPAILMEGLLPRRQQPIGALMKYHMMKRLDDQMRADLADTPAEYYSVLDAICPGGKLHCITVTPSGAPSARDDSHLTYEGAKVVLRAHDLRLHERFGHWPMVPTHHRAESGIWVRQAHPADGRDSQHRAEDRAP